MLRLFLTASAAGAAFPARADLPIRGADGYGHMMGGFGYNGLGMIWGVFLSLIVLVALVAGVVLLVRWIGQPDAAARGAGSRAIEVLNLRFANGEIDAEEYAQRRKLLTG